MLPISVLRGPSLLLLFFLTACEDVADTLLNKAPEYHYLIVNTTTAPLLVTRKVLGNVVGNPISTRQIPPGETKQIWLKTGERGDLVYDMEAGGARLHDFQLLSINRGTTISRRNYDDPKNWAYSHDGLYDATYTLTVGPADF